MGKIVLNEISYSGGGGANVIANPSESPTELLTSIQIGDVVYSISSGGGGNITAVSNNTFTVTEGGQ